MKNIQFHQIQILFMARAYDSSSYDIVSHWPVKNNNKQRLRCTKQSIIMRLKYNKVFV